MAKYSKGAQKNVESAMKRMEKGTLRSGRSNKKVTNPKQAIAIGLSEAREKGAKVPKKKTAVKTKSKTAAKKTARKKAAPKKAASKKGGKSAKAVKSASKKSPSGKAQALVKNKKAISKNKVSAGRSKRMKTDKPVNTIASHNNNTPPVEEKSPEIPKVKIETPIPGNDKRLIAKLTSKVYPHHNIQLSSTPKGGIKPAGKKPLWRR